MSSSNDPSSEADRDAAGRLHGSESKQGSTQPLPKSKGQEKTKKPPSNAGTKALKLSSSGKPSSTHKKDAKAKAKTVSQSNGELTSPTPLLNLETKHLSPTNLKLRRV